VRRLLTWIAVTLGIAALVRWLSRRRGQPATSPPDSAVADPADELRRKLDASREAPPAGGQETSVEERRSEVHEQARSTLEDMRPTDDA
jgi:hypothetical protein